MKLTTLAFVFAGIVALSDQTSKMGNPCTADTECETSNHEECSGTPPKCTCVTSETCDHSPCVADSCNSHGDCVSDGTAAVCTCNVGYGGTKCELVVTTPAGVTTTPGGGSRVSEVSGLAYIILSILVIFFK